MATNIKDLPPCSQQSTSELSDPPEFTDDEMREIVVAMSPATRRQPRRGLANEQQPDTTGVETPQNRLGDESSSNDDKMAAEIHVSPKATRRRVPSKRSLLSNSYPTTSRQPAAKKPKTSTKKWEPNYVTQNSKSPLVGRNLRALLLHPQAWELLTDEDKMEVLALFPDEKHILDAGTPNARPNVIALQNNDNFRHDTEEYVSNLSRDMHDPVWLQDAWAAHGSRAAGSFDKYYIRRLEVDWKTNIPDQLKPSGLELEASHMGPQSETSSMVAEADENDARSENGDEGNGSVMAEDTCAALATTDVKDFALMKSVNSVDEVRGAQEGRSTDGDPDTMRTSPE